MDDNCSSKRKNRDYFRKPLCITKQGPHTSECRGPFPGILTKREKKGKKKENRKASTVGYLGNVRLPRLLPVHESEGNTLAL